MSTGIDLESLPAGVLPTLPGLSGSRPPTGASPRLTLYLCGGVTVTGEHGSLGPRQLGGAKSRLILIALSARPGHPVSKTHLVDLLWGDDPPQGAMGTLETYISLLRKRLDGLATHGATVIRTAPAGYSLDRDGIRVDVDVFDRGCRSAREPGRSAAISLARWSAALDAVDGEFLAGEVGPAWVDDARRQHDLRLAGALAEAAETALRAGRGDAAERFAARGLALDPLHEGCWRLLLESYEARGLHAEGVRGYDACRRPFAEELGCAPGPQVQAVFERLLDGTSDPVPDGLTAAVEAVVRLYSSLTPTEGRPGWDEPPDAPSSVIADAYQLLQDLLVRACGAGGPQALSA